VRHVVQRCIYIYIYTHTLGRERARRCASVDAGKKITIKMQYRRVALIQHTDSWVLY
jgi:hypothetical protein